jgi:hypothetical protein
MPRQRHLHLRQHCGRCGALEDRARAAARLKGAGSGSDAPPV